MTSRPYKPKRKKRFLGMSPLTLRILAVNVAALLILVAGMLYSGQYERELIDTELDALATEARLIAAAISEGSMREDRFRRPVLSEDLATRMLRKLGENSDVRAVLFKNIFNEEGGIAGAKLIADSHRLLGPGGVVQIFELPPPDITRGWREYMSDRVAGLLKKLPARLELPEYPKTPEGNAEAWPHMKATLSGDSARAAWRDEQGNILLTATEPVQHVKQVMGAVMLMRSGKGVEAAVYAAQMTLLKIFFAALCITVLLSLYLSKAIVKPVLRLAEGARKIRHQMTGAHEDIPDLSPRNDEIGELSATLRDMTKALADRMNAIENFAADVAHEIKNPLASVRSAVETMGRLKDPERKEQMLAVIQDDVQRMDRLINDISESSRLDAELGRMETEAVDMSDTLHAIANMFEAQAGERDIEIAVDTPENAELRANVHQGRIGQVLENLVDNALSFAPDGSTVTLRGWLDGEFVVIEVENAGAPIPENRLEKIFERFYSDRADKNDRGRHSGLGLSISRQIVTAHRGSIEAVNLANDDGEHEAVRFRVTLERAWRL